MTAIGAPALADRTGGPAVPLEPAVPLKTWIAVGGALIGAFMAVLNIQITNASLPYIEGGIGTGGVYGTWVSTAYLIGEIIVIPLTDFLSRVFSLRRYLLVNTALFLLFSALCGQASSLGEMIVLRGLQGFTGGVLIPLAFTIVVSMLPPGKRPVGLAGFAVSATFAPAIGPTIGGYFTENYGWPYSFYVNLLPGAFMLAALWYALPKSQMRLGLLAKGDWRGIALMAVGLAAFQTVLDDGNVYDWFGSPFIVELSCLRRPRSALSSCSNSSRPSRWSISGCSAAAISAWAPWATFFSASPSTARPICFPNTCWLRKVSTRSRSVRSWHGRGCRNCWSSRCCRC